MYKLTPLFGSMALCWATYCSAQSVQSGQVACPSGQVSVVHVISEGRLTYNMYTVVPQSVFPHLGINKIEEWLGPDHQSKSITSSVFADANEAGNIVWAYVHYREAQSRDVVLRTSTNIYEYDELSGEPGKRRPANSTPTAESAGGAFLSSDGAFIAQSSLLGKARYAGIDCNVYALPSFIANSRNGRSCVTTLQGHHVVLAQDWVDGQTGMPQTMHATWVEVGKCGPQAVFQPPSSIKFTTQSNKLMFRSDDEDDN